MARFPGDVVKEWKDEVRMQSLFQDLPAQDEDADSYEDKVSFWSNAILLYARHANMPTLTASHLKAVFSRDGSSPSCLAAVLAIMEQRNEVEDVEMFLYAHQPLRQRMTHSLTSPVRWAIKSLTPGRVAKSYVVREVLEDVAFDLLARMRQRCGGHTHPLCDRHEIKDEMNWTDREVHVVLLFLRDVGEAQIGEHDTHELVKLSSRNGSLPPPVTQADFALHNLHTTRHRLTAFETTLMTRADKLKGDALRASQAKQRERALMYLRQRKQVLAAADKHHAAVCQLEAVTLQIEQSQSDRDVISALSTGAKALHTLTHTEQGGLVSDELSDVLGEVEDSMAEAREASNLLAEGFGGDVDNEEELDQELEQLEAEMNLEGLPSPPHALPVPQSQSQSHSRNSNSKAEDDVMRNLAEQFDAAVAL